LLRVAQAARLLGARVVLAGIRPEVAQAIVGLGVDLAGLATTATFQDGIALAAKSVGDRATKDEPFVTAQGRRRKTKD
jgi:rsbT co-antagonist protein RsbR